MGGLSRKDLVKSKTGKIVSKKRSDRGKLIYKKHGLAKWIDAVKKARKDLKCKGFVAVGGTFFHQTLGLQKVEGQRLDTSDGRHCDL